MRIFPVLNESGYYEIRLESIGGLGANLCGKMLGELGVRILDCNSASFSSYGSEKTGTPVKAYIRYCAKEKEIRVHSPVEHPHLLGVFHEALLKDPSVCKGCTEDTVMVINTPSGGKLCVSGKNLYVIDAQRIAMETHSRINVVMLGAIAKAAGFIKLEDVWQICRETVGMKYPDMLEANLEGIRRGYEELQYAGGKEKSQTSQIEKSGDIPKWGYKTAPIGGINPLCGNSVIADLSPSRQGYIPIFIPEKCINCGMCDSTCPDMVFQFAKGIYKGREMMVNRGLDYYHCKGCLRCVAVCPTHALVRGLEADYPQKPYFLPNQDLLRRPEYYEASGPDGYITSESYLTEEKIEGGEV